MTTLSHPVGPADHVLGPADAHVTIVEYLDYECPYCARAHLEVRGLLDRVGDKLRFVPRHFPLVDLHPYAQIAAEAAEAAGAQGRFWEMHALLLENQEALAPAYLVRYAAALGLDLGRFLEDLQRHTHVDKVENDLRSGLRSGVKGTPSFFVGNAEVQTDWHGGNLMRAVQRAA
jgi:protein-disulfide isomerase